MSRKFSSSNFFKDNIKDQRLSSEAQKRAMQIAKSISRWLDTRSQFGLDDSTVKGRTSIDNGIYVDWIYTSNKDRVLSRKIIFKQ